MSTHNLQQRPGRFALIVDMSDVTPEPPTLLLLCTDCGCVFFNDYEERTCARCVERREVFGFLPSSAT
jgi:hypothetical protein